MTEPTLAHAGPPSAAQPLFILAMERRDSFGRTLFGVKDAPTGQQLADMRSAKSLIFEAAERLIGTDLGGGQLGILVDEQLGADEARRPKAAGMGLAMPVQVSGSARFRFEYGDDFGEHIEEFDPDWIKVLVRFNPADPADLQQDQLAGLRRLGDWAATHRGRCPPADLEAGGLRDHRGRAARPRLDQAVRRPRQLVHRAGPQRPGAAGRPLAGRRRAVAGLRWLRG